METILKQKLNIDKTNWTLVKFGDVVYEPKETMKSIVYDGIEHVVGLEHIITDDIHLRNSAGNSENTTFTKKFAKGDVLFGRRRAYLRKAAQASFEGICSGDITVFRAKKELLSELLPFIVNNEKFFDYAIKHSAGGLSPRVKFKDLADYEFLLPPKDQQSQLAELLWAMDELIEREINVCDNLEKIKSSYLKFEIFEKVINEGWPQKLLGELFEINTGNKNAQDSVEDGIYPFFTRANETQKINEYAYDQEALLLPGEGHYQIKYYKGKFNVHQRTYLFTLKENEKLDLQLYRDLIQGKVGELLQKSVGSTVNSLRKPIIENIKVPYLNSKMQKELFRVLNKLDLTINSSTIKITSCKSLQKSIINQVF